MQRRQQSLRQRAKYTGKADLHRVPSLQTTLFFYRIRSVGAVPILQEPTTYAIFLLISVWLSGCAQPW
jgi:hypothetical protein